MTTLGLKEMGKFLWEGREKVLPCWLSQFSFPISFKPKVAITKFVWKMQKKSGIMKSGLDAMPLFLLDHLLNGEKFITNLEEFKLRFAFKLIKSMK